MSAVVGAPSRAWGASVTRHLRGVCGLKQVVMVLSVWSSFLTLQSQQHRHLFPYLRAFGDSLGMLNSLICHQCRRLL